MGKTVLIGLKKTVAAGLAGTIVFLSAGDSLAQSVWEDRRAAQRETLLAARPATLPALERVTAVPPGVDTSVGGGQDPLLRTLRSSGFPFRLPTAHLMVRAVHAPAKASRWVVHIQDVHDLPEAQHNIAAALADLQAQAGDQPLLIGLEGAAGPLLTDHFRSFPDQAVLAKTGRTFVDRALLTGAELAAWTGPVAPRLWGVEDPDLYRTHISAVRDGFAREARFRAALDGLDKRIGALKSAHYPAPLAAWDASVSAHRRAGGSLSAHVRFLAADAPAGAFPRVRAFLKAVDMEAAVDFRAAESERRALIEALSAKLSPADLSALADAGVSLRAGRVSPAAFHSLLSGAAAKAGLPAEAFPAFRNYLRYLAAADGVDRNGFSEELAALERASAEKRLAGAGEKARAVHALAEDARLLRLLLDHALTAPQWAEARGRAADLRAAFTRTAALDGGPAGDAHFAEDAGLFERFYAAGEARDAALARNLPKDARVSVLVAGGFHTEGIVETLRREGAACVVVAPRFEKAGPHDYLDAFRRDKTPLDRLFAGEKLSLRSMLSTQADRALDPDAPAEGPAVLAASLARAAEATAAAMAWLESLGRSLGFQAARLADGDVELRGGAPRPFAFRVSSDGRPVRVRPGGRLAAFLRRLKPLASADLAEKLMLKDHKATLEDMIHRVVPNMETNRFAFAYWAVAAFYSQATGSSGLWNRLAFVAVLFLIGFVQVPRTHKRVYLRNDYRTGYMAVASTQGERVRLSLTMIALHLPLVFVDPVSWWYLLMWQVSQWFHRVFNRNAEVPLASPGLAEARARGRLRGLLRISADMIEDVDLLSWWGRMGGGKKVGQALVEVFDGMTVRFSHQPFAAFVHGNAPPTLYRYNPEKNELEVAVSPEGDFLAPGPATALLAEILFREWIRRRRHGGPSSEPMVRAMRRAVFSTFEGAENRWKLHSLVIARSQKARAVELTQTVGRGILQVTARRPQAAGGEIIVSEDGSLARRSLSRSVTKERFRSFLKVPKLETFRNDLIMALLDASLFSGSHIVVVLPKTIRPGVSRALLAQEAVEAARFVLEGGDAARVTIVAPEPAALEAAVQRLTVDTPRNRIGSSFIMRSLFASPGGRTPPNAAFGDDEMSNEEINPVIARARKARRTAKEKKLLAERTEAWKKAVARRLREIRQTTKGSEWEVLAALAPDVEIELVPVPGGVARANGKRALAHAGFRGREEKILANAVVYLFVDQKTLMPRLADLAPSGVEGLLSDEAADALAALVSHELIHLDFTMHPRPRMSAREAHISATKVHQRVCEVLLRNPRYLDDAFHMIAERTRGGVPTRGDPIAWTYPRPGRQAGRIILRADGRRSLGAARIDVLDSPDLPKSLAAALQRLSHAGERMLSLRIESLAVSADREKIVSILNLTSGRNRVGDADLVEFVFDRPGHMEGFLEEIAAVRPAGIPFFTRVTAPAGEADGTDDPQIGRAVTDALALWRARSTKEEEDRLHILGEIMRRSMVKVINRAFNAKPPYRLPAYVPFPAKDIQDLLARGTVQPVPVRDAVFRAGQKESWMHVSFPGATPSPAGAVIFVAVDERHFLPKPAQQFIRRREAERQPIFPELLLSEQAVSDSLAAAALEKAVLALHRITPVPIEGLPIMAAQAATHLTAWLSSGFTLREASTKTDKIPGQRFSPFEEDEPLSRVVRAIYDRVREDAALARWGEEIRAAVVARLRSALNDADPPRAPKDAPSMDEIATALEQAAIVPVPVPGAVFSDGEKRDWIRVDLRQTPPAPARFVIFLAVDEEHHLPFPALEGVRALTSKGAGISPEGHLAREAVMGPLVVACVEKTVLALHRLGAFESSDPRPLAFHAAQRVSEKVLGGPDLVDGLFEDHLKALSRPAPSAGLQRWFLLPRRRDGILAALLLRADGGRTPGATPVPLPAYTEESREDLFFNNLWGALNGTDARAVRIEATDPVFLKDEHFVDMLLNAVKADNSGGAVEGRDAPPLLYEIAAPGAAGLRSLEEGAARVVDNGRGRYFSPVALSSVLSYRLSQRANGARASVIVRSVPWTDRAGGDVTRIALDMPDADPLAAIDERIVFRPLDRLSRVKTREIRIEILDPRISGNDASVARILGMILGDDARAGRANPRHALVYDVYVPAMPHLAIFKAAMDADRSHFTPGAVLSVPGGNNASYGTMTEADAEAFWEKLLQERQFFDALFPRRIASWTRPMWELLFGKLAPLDPAEKDAVMAAARAALRADRHVIEAALSPSIPGAGLFGPILDREDAARYDVRLVEAETGLLEEGARYAAALVRALSPTSAAVLLPAVNGRPAFSPTVLEAVLGHELVQFPWSFLARPLFLVVNAPHAWATMSDRAISARRFGSPAFVEALVMDLRTHRRTGTGTSPVLTGEDGDLSRLTSTQLWNRAEALTHHANIMLEAEKAGTLRRAAARMAAQAASSLLAGEDFPDDAARAKALGVLQALEAEGLNTQDMSVVTFALESGGGEAGARGSVAEVDALRADMTPGLGGASIARIKEILYPSHRADTPGRPLQDRYELLARLSDKDRGESEIWAAKDLKTGGTVAVKILKPGVTAPAVIQMFLRDVVMMRDAQGDLVVPFLSSGILDDRPYVVMPLLDALPPFKQRSHQDVEHIARDLLTVLARLHGMGIVHGDVKIENLLSFLGRYLLIDFGAAFRLEPGEDVRLTGGNLVATLRYLPPEYFADVFQKREPALGIPSDLYAAGHLLLELMLGRPLDRSNLARGAGLYDQFENTYAIKRNYDVDALLAELRRRNWPETLIRVAIKLHDIEPEVRYASAAEALADLDLPAAPAREPSVSAARPAPETADFSAEELTPSELMPTFALPLAEPPANDQTTSGETGVGPYSVDVVGRFFWIGAASSVLAALAFTAGFVLLGAGAGKAEYLRWSVGAFISFLAFLSAAPFAFYLSEWRDGKEFLRICAKPRELEVSANRAQYRAYYESLRASPGFVDGDLWRELEEALPADAEARIDWTGGKSKKALGFTYERQDDGTMIAYVNPWIVANDDFVLRGAEAPLGGPQRKALRRKMARRVFFMEGLAARRKWGRYYRHVLASIFADIAGLEHPRPLAAGPISPPAQTTPATASDPEPSAPTSSRPLSHGDRKNVVWGMKPAVITEAPAVQPTGKTVERTMSYQKVEVPEELRQVRVITDQVRVEWEEGVRKMNLPICIALVHDKKDVDKDKDVRWLLQYFPGARRGVVLENDPRQFVIAIQDKDGKQLAKLLMHAERPEGRTVAYYQFFFDAPAEALLGGKTFLDWERETLQGWLAERSIRTIIPADASQGVRIEESEKAPPREPSDHRNGMTMTGFKPVAPTGERASQDPVLVKEGIRSPTLSRLPPVAEEDVPTAVVPAPPQTGRKRTGLYSPLMEKDIPSFDTPTREVTDQPIIDWDRSAVPTVATGAGLSGRGDLFKLLKPLPGARAVRVMDNSAEGFVLHLFGADKVTLAELTVKAETIDRKPAVTFIFQFNPDVPNEQILYGSGSKRNWLDKAFIPFLKARGFEPNRVGEMGLPLGSWSLEGKKPLSSTLAVRAARRLRPGLSDDALAEGLAPKLEDAFKNAVLALSIGAAWHQGGPWWTILAAGGGAVVLSAAALGIAHHKVLDLVDGRVDWRRASPAERAVIALRLAWFGLVSPLGFAHLRHNRAAVERLRREEAARLLEEALPSAESIGMDARWDDARRAQALAAQAGSPADLGASDVVRAERSALEPLARGAASDPALLPGLFQAIGRVWAFEALEGAPASVAARALSRLAAPARAPALRALIRAGAVKALAEDLGGTAPARLFAVLSEAFWPGKGRAPAVETSPEDLAGARGEQPVPALESLAGHLARIRALPAGADSTVALVSLSEAGEAALGDVEAYMARLHPELAAQVRASVAFIHPGIDAGVARDGVFDVDRILALLKDRGANASQLAVFTAHAEHWPKGHAGLLIVPIHRLLDAVSTVIQTLVLAAQQA